jgi:hypothetical protein
MDFKEYTESAERLELVNILSESQSRVMGRKSLGADEVIKALDGKVPYMLVGAHATGQFTPRPRATGDVDLIVADREKAKALLIAKYPWLHDRGNRLVDDKGDPFIDLLDANHPFYRVIVSDGRIIRGMNVPSVEGVLVMKFVSAHSPLRNPGKKKIDEGDFIAVASANTVDLDKAKSMLTEGDPELAYMKWEEFLGWIKTAKEAAGWDDNHG